MEINIPRLAEKVWPYLQTFVDNRINVLRPVTPTQHQRSVAFNLRVKEVDGDPDKVGIGILEFTDGTVTITGNKATIQSGGGGGGGDGYFFHVESADLTTGTLTVQIPARGSTTLTTVQFETTATCEFNMLKNGVSQGSVSVSGTNGSTSVSASVVTGDILTISITSVTVIGRLNVLWHD